MALDVEWRSLADALRRGWPTTTSVRYYPPRIFVRVHKRGLSFVMTAIVIAEIGCNHQGRMEQAFELIRVAATHAKADVAKFQKRNSRELLSPEQYGAPHPNQAFSFGRTYGEHREFLEFDVAQHRELKAYCEEYKIEYSTSVWDLTSAREMISIEPRFLKVPSACNLNRRLLELLCAEFPGEIHISLGMTTPEEQDRIVRLVSARDRAQDVVLYACTSGYPVAIEDVCLLEIPRLIERYGTQVRSIGFSGHHLGTAADVAALALGASHIERHFTLDRTAKGTDHAASLEPDALRSLCRDVREVALALGAKRAAILPVEEAQRAKLKREQIKWDL